MLYETDTYVNRAKEELVTADPERLKYACLELRMAIERIVYWKLQNRFDRVSPREISAWQPKRAIEQIMELVDDRIMYDSSLAIASEAAGVPSEDLKYQNVGTSRGVDPRKVGKAWQKLGSLLHVSPPNRKNGPWPSPNWVNAWKIIKDTIAMIEEIDSGTLDAHFSRTYSFNCERCNSPIVRNSDLLKPSDVVSCQNPSCNASYKIRKTGDNISHAIYMFEASCPKCKHVEKIHANKIRFMNIDSIHEWVCDECGTKQSLIFRAFLTDVNDTLDQQQP